MHARFGARSGRRLVAGLAATALAGVGLVGCSPSGSRSSSTNEGSATSGNLVWWGWSPQIGPAQEFITAFNKKYPNIKITYKLVTLDGWDAALRPALASSSGPDLYGISPGPKVANYGDQAVDMTSAIKASLGSDWKSKVTPLDYVPQMYTSSGKLVGAGVGTSDGGSLWINKTLFDKYKLTPPKTLKEWTSDCAVFKRNGVTCYVQGAAQAAFDRDHLQAISNSIKPGVWTAASKGKAKWTDPTIVHALTVWKSLFSNGIMQPGAIGAMQFPDAQNQFFKGNTATILMGSWEVQYSSKRGMAAAQAAAGVATPKPFVMIPIPYPSVTGTSAPDYSMYGDVDYAVAVNSKSKHIAAAKTFAAWLGTTQAGQQAIANSLGSFPSLLSVKPDWSAVGLVDPSVQQAPIQALIDAAGKITEPRLGILSQDMTNAVGVAATTVGAGQATPAQAAKTLQDTFDAGK